MSPLAEMLREAFERRAQEAYERFPDQRDARQREEIQWEGAAGDLVATLAAGDRVFVPDDLRRAAIERALVDVRRAGMYELGNTSKHLEAEARRLPFDGYERGDFLKRWKETA